MLYKIKTNMSLEIEAETRDEALAYFRQTIIDNMTSAVVSKTTKDKSPRCISAMITGNGSGLLMKDGSSLSDYKPVAD